MKSTSEPAIVPLSEPESPMPHASTSAPEPPSPQKPGVEVVDGVAAGVGRFDPVGGGVAVFVGYGVLDGDDVGVPFGDAPRECVGVPEGVGVGRCDGVADPDGVGGEYTHDRLYGPLPPAKAAMMT